MALGARQSQVVWMVLKDAFILTLCGIAIGAPLAIASTRIISSLLFSVSATDPATLLVIVVAIIGVTSIAGFIPARPFFARRKMALDSVVVSRL